MSTITAIKTVLEGANIDPKLVLKQLLRLLPKLLNRRPYWTNLVVINNNYKVTVAGVDGSNKFLLNGEAAPGLNLVQGETYIFDVSDTTNTNHPLDLKTHRENIIEVLSSGIEGQSDASVTLIVPTSELNQRYILHQPRGSNGSRYFDCWKYSRQCRNGNKNFFDFTDPAEIRKLVDLAIEKANAQKADINEFDNEADLLSSAISNVNSSLTGSKDLLSQESIDLFSQSFLLNEQIQLFMKDTRS